MDENAKYGNTNPVANCGKANGVPDWVAFVTADVMIHGPRGGATEDAAKAWLKEHGHAPINPYAEGTFGADLAQVCARVMV